MGEHSFVCGATEGGCRVDVWLASRAEGLTRSALQKLISSGLCRIDGRPIRPSYKVRPGDVVELIVPEAQKWEIEAEDIPLSILHQDDDIAVIDKRPGMVVHPGAGHRAGTLVSALLHHIPGLTGVGGVERPGIVHRLDKGTSGIMVIAKNGAALSALQDQFRARAVRKTYVALLWGSLRNRTGEISLAIGRSRARARMTTRARRSKTAVTRYAIAERFEPWCDLVHAFPATGRTHQVRVHFAAIGHPLVGDPLYGRRRGQRSGLPAVLLAFDRPALHAWRLEFRHPRSGEMVSFEADLAGDFKGLIEGVRRLRSSPE